MNAFDKERARKYLALVNRKGKTHVRHLTYRERWYKKHGLKDPRTQKSESDAEDASVSLSEHDDAYHDGNYREGQRCKFREALAEKDKADSILETHGERVGRINPWVTPEMDAEYEEAFDAYEEAERNNDVNELSRCNKLLSNLLLRHARRAFAKSVLLDDDGFPMVMYHGTPHGGFTVFNTDGKGKTEGTGAWFSASLSHAKTYSGSTSDVNFPRITEKYLRDKGILTDKYAIVDEHGYVIDDSIRDTAKEVSEDYDGKVEKVYVLGGWRGFEGLSGFDDAYTSLQDAIKTVQRNPQDYIEDLLDQSCLYTVYVNMTNPTEIDADGSNWDSILTSWEVVDAAWNLVESASSKEDADEIVERLKEEAPNARYTVKSSWQSTDEIARDCRRMGVDGVIIKDVDDHGPFDGWGLGETDYVSFKPSNIKMADIVTFDDDGNLIPLSRRFDFSNDDIRF